MLKVGPFPGTCPENSSDCEVWDEKGRTQIAQIFISYGAAFINSIAFQYINKEDGGLVLTPFFGSQKLDSSHFTAVTFKDAANNKEYVTRVSGSYGISGSISAITTLTIETNVGSYGPLGNPEPFHTRLKFDYSFGPQHQFGGFHGVSDPHFLRSIGVYVNPIHRLTTSSSNSKRSKRSSERD